MSSCSQDSESPKGMWFDTNQRDCQVWNSNPQIDETASWSGGCLNGKTHGKGTMTWRWRENGKIVERLIEQRMSNGRNLGQVKIIYENGDTYIGKLDENGNRAEGQGTYTSFIAQSQAKPLSEILSKSSDEKFIMSFATKRCAALYLEVAATIKNDNEQTAIALINKSSELTISAAMIDNNKDANNITSKEAFDADAEIKSIRKVLTQMSVNSYAKTGSYLSVHQEDLMICREIFPI